MSFVIDGVVPVLPTPFHPDESVDWENIPALIDFAVRSGACAVCLPAYASEFYKLSETERLGLVEHAVAAARGRIPVIAQVNSPSCCLARAWAARAADLGASAIATAVPRMFAIPETDLFRYFEDLLGSAGLPWIIQDFHPGGPSLGVPFIEKLHRARPNFRYIKLEEPMLIPKIHAIREATGGAVGVLEGWGGMYTLELASAGIAGVLPGLALTDILGSIFTLTRNGQRAEAYPMFAAILPQIVYSLHSIELFHHVEKRLLAARRVLNVPEVRSLRLDLAPHDVEYIDFLNARVLDALEQFGFSRGPAGSA